MLPKLFGRWPLLRVHSKTAFTKIICLRRQSKILWQWRTDFCLVELKGGFSDDDSDSRLKRVHTCRRTATASCPLHGRSPVHISNTTQPTLQMSILELYPFFWLLMTSGAIQNTDPCIEVWAPIMLMSSVLFEIPKSVILQCPNSSTRMLSAFRSWNDGHVSVQREDIRGTKYSVDDPLGMEVLETFKDLRSEGLRYVLIESTVFSQDAGNRTTRNVFKEAIKPTSAV